MAEEDEEPQFGLPPSETKRQIEAYGKRARDIRIRITKIKVAHPADYLARQDYQTEKEELDNLTERMSEVRDLYQIYLFESLDSASDRLNLLTLLLTIVTVVVGILAAVQVWKMLS